jgi:hypothetical protein
MNKRTTVSEVVKESGYRSKKYPNVSQGEIAFAFLKLKIAQKGPGEILPDESRNDFIEALLEDEMGKSNIEIFNSFVNYIEADTPSDADQRKYEDYIYRENIEKNKPQIAEQIKKFKEQFYESTLFPDNELCSGVAGKIRYEIMRHFFFDTTPVFENNTHFLSLTPEEVKNITGRDLEKVYCDLMFTDGNWEPEKLCGLMVKSSITSAVEEFCCYEMYSNKTNKYTARELSQPELALIFKNIMFSCIRGIELLVMENAIKDTSDSIIIKQACEKEKNLEKESERIKNELSDTQRKVREKEAKIKELEEKIKKKNEEFEKFKKNKDLRKLEYQIDKLEKENEELKKGKKKQKNAGEKEAEPTEANKKENPPGR